MKNQLNKIAKDTNLFLKKYIQEQENSKLVYAMKYGLFPGGKKIRSKILIDIGSLFSINYHTLICLLYTSPSPRDPKTSRMPSSA